MSAGAKKILDVMNNAGDRASALTASKLGYGTVVSVSPLTITRDGDNDRAALTEDFLVLSPMCKKFSIMTAKHSHIVPSSTTQIADSHVHAVPQNTTSTELPEIVIWPGLSVGERVILLSFNNGQRFFVERIDVHDTAD